MSLTEAAPHQLPEGRESRASDANVVELPIPGDDLVRVDPGEYLAVYARHVYMTVFRTAKKVRMDFKLVAHPDLVLPRWYPVRDYRGGRIHAGRHSDIVREISAVLGRRVRYDRIPVCNLENLILRVLVCDVVTDRKQDRLAEVNRYSVISRLLERVQ